MGPPRVCEAERVDATTRGAMAERRGFEPPSRFYPTNRLAGGCLQPLGHLSKPGAAEGVEFEPTYVSLSGFKDRRLKPLGHPSASPPGRATIVNARRALKMRRTTSRRDVRVATAGPTPNAGSRSKLTCAAPARNREGAGFDRGTHRPA